MKKKILLLSLLVFVSGSAFAASPAEVKSGIIAVRDSLLTMLKDASKRTPEQRALVKSSADKVSSMINELNVTPDKADKLSEMKKNWEEFSKVRVEKVVPKITSGTPEDLKEAEALANGEQKERLMKIMKICDELK